MHKPKESIGGIPTFYGVYMSMKQEVMSYGGKGWNAETERQYDQTVLNHVLPYLNQEKKHIGELTIADYDKAKKNLSILVNVFFKKKLKLIFPDMLMMDQIQ